MASENEQAIKQAVQKLSAEQNLGPQEQLALEAQLRERMHKHGCANVPAEAPPAFPWLAKPAKAAPAASVALKTLTASTANQSLMLKMRTYAVHRGIDVNRLLVEAGGKKTTTGGGTISKTKFCTTLLDAFHTMCIPALALDGLAERYGTGPVARGQHIEVAWCTFVNDLMALEPSSRAPSERSTITSGFA